MLVLTKFRFSIAFILVMFILNAKLFSQCCPNSAACPNIIFTHNDKNEVDPSNHICGCNQFCTGYFEPVIIGNAFCFSEDYCYINIFNDEFNDSKLNSDYWIVMDGLDVPDTRNVYKPENIVSTGNSVIVRTKKEITNNVTGGNRGWTIPPKTFYYSSGFLSSKYKFPGLGYSGKIEARIRVNRPVVSAGKTETRSAFWLTGKYVHPSTNVSYEWNEIDMFEFDEPNAFITSMLFDMPNDGNPLGRSSYGTNISDETTWHIYTVEWNPSIINVYLDGNPVVSYCRYIHTNGIPVMCPNIGDLVLRREVFPQGPMELLFTNHVLNVLNITELHDMEIDYVHVFYKYDFNKDRYITDANEIPTNVDEFNFIAGKNIVIDCNYTLKKDQMLKLIATESITIKSGFKMEPGSKLIKEIKTDLCPMPNGFVMDLKEPKLDTPLIISPINIRNYDVTVKLEEATVSFMLRDKLKDVGYIEVFDVSGKKVIAAPFMNDSYIADRYLFKTGVYLLKLSQNNDILYTSKFAVY